MTTTAEILPVETLEAFYPLIGIMVLLMIIGICATQSDNIMSRLGRRR